MATKQKKKPAARKKPGRKRIASRRPKPVRREVGAFLCLMLAVCSILGYFQVQAVFIDFFCSSVRGLIGFGYWFWPVCLLISSAILGFHHGRPVLLRVWGTMLIPVLSGAIFHLLLAQPHILDSHIFSFLWIEGKNMQAGGVLSGFLAEILAAVFSKIGAGVFLLVLLTVLVMIVCSCSWGSVTDWLRGSFQASYDGYDEEPIRKTVRRKPTARRKTGASRRDPASWEAISPPRRRTLNIDIPVDEGPLSREKPQKVQPVTQTEPAPSSAKKSFFNRQPNVRRPDQVLLTDLSGRKEPCPDETEPSESSGSLSISEPVSPGYPNRTRTGTPKKSREGREKRAISTSALETSRVEIVREPSVSRRRHQKTVPLETGVLEQTSADAADSGYQYPPLSLLRTVERKNPAGFTGDLRTNQVRLVETIRSFGIHAKLIRVTCGPSVTRYELELSQGVRLSKLTNLSDDIALAFGASGVRIAPIPDQVSTVGIEVPNKSVSPVFLRDVIDSEAFREDPSKSVFAVGKDITGSCVVSNIAQLPHLLIAGTTGSGKSVCINSLIVSLLYRASPEEIRFIMVDPKIVELGIYNGIPHLLIPVVTDPQKAAGALQWTVDEMEKRYRIFSEAGVRDLDSYNAHVRRTEDGTPLPQVIIVIDELADLMMVAAKEVEQSIARVAQKGRASGLHLILATQRPSTDVLTGLIKSNIPSRISFAVASSLESRIILDQSGAEKLVGHGDMLYAPIGASKPIRVQGCFISDEEVTQVIQFLKQQNGDAQYDEAVLHEVERNASEKEKRPKASPESPADDPDDLLSDAIAIVVEDGTASVTRLQRRLKLGYTRAARLVERMEEQGIVGPFERSKPRQVLISKEQWQEMQEMQHPQGRIKTDTPAEKEVSASPDRPLDVNSENF